MITLASDVSEKSVYERNTLLLYYNNTHKLGEGGSRSQSLKIFLYGISSLQYNLFVPSIVLSSVEVSRLVRRPVPLLSLTDSTKMQSYIPCWCDFEIIQLGQGFSIRIYWVMIKACLHYQNILFMFCICSFRLISVTVLAITTFCLCISLMVFF